MKKAILFLLTASLSTGSFAQHKANHYINHIQPHNDNGTRTVAAKTTAVGDTVTLRNIAASDTLVIYSLATSTDSGYVTGTNAYGDMGFAEKYDFNGNDSSMRIIGVMAQFAGKINAASTKSVNFKVWDVSSQVAITGSLAYDGFPHNSFDTLTVPVTQLGIGPVSDTMKTFFFANSTDTLNGAFYIGYDMSYNYATLLGDTLGLASSKDGHRTDPLYKVIINVSDLTGDTTRDTVIYVQNATQWSDNTWHENYTDNDSIFNNLAIYPIVIIGQPTGVKNVTRNNLSFYGNFPNPAVNSTNIQFSLSKNADVSIQVMDMKAHVLRTLLLKSQNAGQHIVPLETDMLPSGNYIYLIRTSDNDGVAGQMTVIR